VRRIGAAPEDIKGRESLGIFIALIETGERPFGDNLFVPPINFRSGHKRSAKRSFYVSFALDRGRLSKTWIMAFERDREYF
jgi:hypothetical protein